MNHPFQAASAALLLSPSRRRHWVVATQSRPEAAMDALAFPWASDLVISGYDRVICSRGREEGSMDSI